MHDVLRVQDADDVVERAGGYTGSRLYGLVATMRSTSRSGVAISIAASRVARHHQLPRVAQSEPQRAVQAHLLLRLEQPAVAALRDQQIDLFRRMDVTMRRRRHRAGSRAAAAALRSRMTMNQE